METKLVNLVLLNGTNYATWKVQCKMALIRDGVWNIVNGTEIVPDSRTKMGLHAKYLSRKGSRIGDECTLSRTRHFCT